MKTNSLKDILNNTDIYIIDQIIKDRYYSLENILDVVFGSGRNLHWFYTNNFTIFGIDISEEHLQKKQVNG